MPPAKHRQKLPKPPPAILSVLTALRNLVEDPLWSSPNPPLNELHTLLSQIQRLQTASPYYTSIIPTRTPSTLATFTAWLSEHGLDPATSPFRLGFLDSHHDNATLFATRRIPKHQLFICVSDALILAPDRSAGSPLSLLLKSAPAVAAMPSLTLVLQLLLESAAPSSRFAPYINALPASFSIPLCAFSPDDLLALAPSRAAEAAIKTLRATARDYTHIYSLLHRNKIPGLPASLLSWDNYVWATAVAMTRQNQIPAGKGTQCALVPVWDMCNHSPGPATTAVGLSADGEVVVESKAMRDFEEGEAITMSYGERPNVELLLYSGFVQTDNEYDKVALDLRLTKEMALAKFKAKVVLGKVNMTVEELEGEQGWIVPLTVDASNESAERALGVARVMVARKESVGRLLKGGEESMRKPLEGEEEDKARRVVREAAERKVQEYKEVREGVSKAAQELIGKLHEEEKKVYQHVLTCLET